MAANKSRFALLRLAPPHAAEYVPAAVPPFAIGFLQGQKSLQPTKLKRPGRVTTTKPVSQRQWALHAKGLNSGGATPSSTSSTPPQQPIKRNPHKQHGRRGCSTLAAISPHAAGHLRRSHGWSSPAMRVQRPAWHKLGTRTRPCPKPTECCPSVAARESRHGTRHQRRDRQTCCDKGNKTAACPCDTPGPEA